MVSEIIKEIMKDIPSGKICDAVLEGANVVLYTKDKVFLSEGTQLIKDIVNKIKKRVELRADPSICLDIEKSKKIINHIIPEDATAEQVIFDVQRSVVIIESENPSVAMGKQGSILKEIKDKTNWTPLVRRTPGIRSQLIEDIRSVLYQNNDERRKFLNSVGESVYKGWVKGKKEEWVRLSILGAGRQVGRSAILLQTPMSKVLLDCGINPAGSGSEAYPILEAPEFNINELDAIIISHAHLDHSGFLPYLFKFGYRGPVYCTDPTRDIMSLLQLDMIKIMAGQGLDPLYSGEDVKKTVLHTITLDYEEVTDITPDIRITLYNAGHILGSSMVHLHIGNGLHNFLYTADLKYANSRLLSAAVTKFPRLESLMIESTYGGKDNVFPEKEVMEEDFMKHIVETVDRGGKVLLPVLGVGRAQEVMLVLYDKIKDGQLKEIPIYIDGMVWDINAITTAYPEYLSKTVKNQIFQHNDNPFMDPMFKRIGSKKERTDLLENQGSCIIIATSGMLTGGASQEYFEFLAPDKRHTLIFTSYQGPGSLGRRVQQGEKEIMCSINGRKSELVTINMEIQTLEGLSGHSSRSELLNFIKKCSPSPKKVIINHGESSRCLDLASSLHKLYKVETVAPKNLEAIRLK
jgi:KH/beta-lactamase-domain protein